MARKTVLVSDISGEAINDRNHALVTVRLASEPKVYYELDASNAEVVELVRVSRQRPRKGRPARS